jgi:hypothetical protein
VMILVVNIVTGGLTALLDPRIREDGLALGSAAS